jgi:hypothetical protein
MRRAKARLLWRMLGLLGGMTRSAFVLWAEIERKMPEMKELEVMGD